MLFALPDAYSLLSYGSQMLRLLQHNREPLYAYTQYTPLIFVLGQPTYLLRNLSLHHQGHAGGAIPYLAQHIAEDRVGDIGRYIRDNLVWRCAIVLLWIKIKDTPLL